MKYRLEHRTNKKTSSGAPSPRGAILKKNGVNFTIYSRYAKEIFLLLFDSPDGEPTDIINIKTRSGNVWHIYVHGIKAGQLYAYKVRGPYDPAQAMRFNEHKLLLDPYAKALTGKAKNIDHLLLAYDNQSDEKDLVMDNRDNTHIVPKSIVIDDAFDWQDDKSPNIPMEELIIYEVHLKGFTAHPSSGVKYPGTYLGFIEKIPYLKELGINAVELLPIQEFYCSDTLQKNNLYEYWGYNTIGYFAPEVSYSTRRKLGCQVEEFKTLIRELHKAGIEVILDVVYNHTGEGNELGPTLCFKGLDNSTFYALKGSDSEPYRHYKEYATGCGNMLNIDKASVRHGVIDSLRYWVKTMRVDGFRFDLAPVLSRKMGRFRKDSPFLRAVSQDPILNRVKMIAEPWDLKGHHYGGFPNDWLEWNDHYRNTIRRFIKSDAGQGRELARALTGSQELYLKNEINPSHSINFVTCHDGFTLSDLFSYNHKHNEKNREDNRDGSDHNDSWNCGMEGKTDNANIIQLRKQLTKNALCCLFFSLGTPMLLGGDEIMRTQQGNNNAYCQDNEISWLNWDYVGENSEILKFCKILISFRKHYGVFKTKRFLSDENTSPELEPDIIWYGKDLEQPSWDDPESKILSYQLLGRKNVIDPIDNHLFFIYNADPCGHIVQLPKYENAKWYRLIDSSLEHQEDFTKAGKDKNSKSFEKYEAKPRSIAVLLGKYM